MRRIAKYIVERTYKPLLVKYLSGTTIYTYKNIRLEIPPEVFHPGFFFSTKLLLQYISRLSLAQKTFLELGAGSGLISIYAAQQGAKVTASDINTVAIKTLKKNKYLNKVELTVIESDLFRKIPQQTFDLVAINPPYYKKQPVSEKEYAWYCGENGEFFKNLFKELNHYLHNTSQVYMILCDGCDIEMIKEIAAANCFTLKCIATHANWIEKSFIYNIQKNNPINL